MEQYVLGVPKHVSTTRLHDSFIWSSQRADSDDIRAGKVLTGN